MYDKFRMEHMIRISLKNNNLVNFICGESVFSVRSDPHDRGSAHSFYASQLALNDYFKKYPNSGIDKVYEETIIKILDNDYGNNYVYDVFKSIDMQLFLEREGKASFSVDKEVLKVILPKIKEKIEYYSEMLKKAKYNEGAGYENGVYGYLEYASDEFYKKTGHKIM